MKKVNSLYVFPESGSFDKKYSTDSYTVRHLTIHPNVVYYIQFANQITIMAVAHEKQSPQTVSSMITRFIEHHTQFLSGRDSMSFISDTKLLYC